MIARCDTHLVDDPRSAGGQGVEHLHRLDDDDRVGAVDGLSRLDMHLCDDGRERRDNRIGRTV